MEVCYKMIPYLVHYKDTIQVAANSYLCLPTAPGKERKEKKANDVNVGQDLLLLNNVTLSRH